MTGVSQGFVLDEQMAASSQITGGEPGRARINETDGEFYLEIITRCVDPMSG